jgi:hypothetical protein
MKRLKYKPKNMKRNKLTFSGICIMVLLVTFAACKKDNNNATDVSTEEDSGYAEEQARMEQSFDDAESLSDEAYTNGASALKGGAYLLSSCATVTKDTISNPHTLTIDFGTANCLCNDGRYRRGQIIVTYAGKYRDSGYVRTIGFNGYYVNNNQVTGTRQITNMGHNSNGHLYYNISVNGAIVLDSNKGTITQVSTRTRTWVNGENTLVLADDVYEITGSGTLTRPNNTTVAENISSPLIVANNCQWIKQGIMQLTPQGKATRSLNYGNGNCDNQAVLTVGSKTKTITLH